MPATTVFGRQIRAGNLQNIPFASLPTLNSTDRGVIWCPDHPVYGATDLWWDGNSWTVNDFAISSVVASVSPAATTTTTAMGTATSVAGTLSTPTPASTNRVTAERRTVYTSAATVGALAYQRQNALLVWRGNAAGIGGFTYSHRFALDTLVAGNRGFVGLLDSVANPTNIDPLTATTPGGVGVAFSANTGNMSIVNNITGSARTAVDLGSNFTVATGILYELNIWCNPNGSSLNYRIVNLNNNQFLSGALTTNIPANTTFLAPVIWICNNATAAACAIASCSWEIRART